jgi:acetyl esterase/lipase
MAGILQSAFKPKRCEPWVAKLDLPYVRDGSPRQKMDLYLPAKGRDLPLVIYIHGGGYLMGSRSDPGAPAWLTGMGYAVACLDHRYSTESPFPGPFEDCMAAVRVLRQSAHLFRLDPRRFIAWGESSGGHLASMLGLASRSPTFDVLENRKADPGVQAVIDFAGPTDFLKIDSQALPGTPKASAPDSAESLLLGGPLRQKVGLAALANPIRYVTRDAPPFFVAHGEQDRAVPIGQSRDLVEELRRAGAYVEYHPLSGADHRFQGGCSKALLRLEEEALRFLSLVSSPSFARQPAA